MSSSSNQSLSRRTALAGGLGLILAAHGLDTFAQESTPGTAEFSRDGHPLVGAWEVRESDYGPAPISYAIFDADGTWLHLNSLALAIGIWRPTGERTAEGVEFYESLQEFERLFDLVSPVPDDLLEQQSIKFWFEAEVDAEGNTFTTKGNVVNQEGKPRGAAGEIAGVRLGAIPTTATPTP